MIDRELFCQPDRKEIDLLNPDSITRYNSGRRRITRRLKYRESQHHLQTNASMLRINKQAAAEGREILYRQNCFMSTCPCPMSACLHISVILPFVTVVHGRLEECHQMPLRPRGVTDYSPPAYSGIGLHNAMHINGLELALPTALD
jgi:hypothetical protein